MSPRSQGCQQLDTYEHEHGDNFEHSEDPGDPDYTALDPAPDAKPADAPHDFERDPQRGQVRVD